jgi:two-component system cell cycle response regulator DivK
MNNAGKTGNKKILIVEDNELNLKLFYDLLVMQQYNVIATGEGNGVYELVLSEQPDLILMDIQLQGVSGAELIEELKQSDKTSHIPIIAITAFAMKNDEAKIMQSGCELYLSKPVSIDNFFQSVKKFLIE